MQQINTVPGKWIYTNSGKKIEPLNPDSNMICIKDIAHALSNNCRYTGHSNYFYSVAQHSVIVSKLCEPKFALYGLLHDASEAYLSDIASPVKRAHEFDFYKQHENRLQSVIYKKFGLDPCEPQNIKYIDTNIRTNEMYYLFSFDHEFKPFFDIDIQPMSPKEAKKEFLKRFDELR